MTFDDKYYPESWGNWFREKIEAKREEFTPENFRVEMNAIAGSLLAADIDVTFQLMILNGSHQVNLDGVVSDIGIYKDSTHGKFLRKIYPTFNEYNVIPNINYLSVYYDNTKSDMIGLVGIIDKTDGVYTITNCFTNQEFETFDKKSFRTALCRFMIEKCIQYIKDHKGKTIILESLQPNEFELPVLLELGFKMNPIHGLYQLPLDTKPKKKTKAK